MRDNDYTFALRLTLIALLLHPVGSVWSPGILGLSAIGLVVPAAISRPALWGALTILCAARVILDWPLQDNHAYLLVYWCLAIALVLSRSKRPNTDLAKAAALLIGFTFAFASLWKLALSPDFLNGNFMRFTWLVDERFEWAARTLGGLSSADIDANRAFLAGAANAPDLLIETTRLRSLTVAATAFTAVIEPALAVAYLWPGEGGPARWRRPLLLTFCIVTFAFAPVVGFAWLLLSMDAARSSDTSRARLGIGIVFALVFAYGQILEADTLMSWLD